MQKLIQCLLFFLLGIPNVFSAPYHTLTKADSLFERHQYTQAYTRYAHVYRRHNQSSKRMLLRMAYIQEGLQNYPMALFYLVDYYAVSDDALAFRKIKALAKAQNMEGYTMSATQYAQNKIRHYRYPISALCVLIWGICWVIHLLSANHKKKHKNAPIRLLLMTACIVLCLCLWHPEVWMRRHALQSHTEWVSLHQGPSGASPRTHTIAPGTRMDVLKTNPIWTHIRHRNQTGYVRTRYLRFWDIK